ncbi:MAG: monovalent cation/H+ antiporter complex subunit F [Nocardioidaceae bacterium]
MTGAALLVVLLLGAGPCLVGLCRGSTVARLTALVTVSTELAAVAVLYADDVARTSYLDVGLLLVLLTFAGTLVYARFFGRTL